MLTYSDSDYKVTFTNPKLTNEMTCCLELNLNIEPMITSSDTKVTYSDPKVTPSDPTHLPLPPLTSTYFT